MNLEQIWEELEDSARISGSLQTRLLTPDFPMDVEAAVDGRNGQRMLLFRFEDTVLRSDIEVPDSRGIGVRRVKYPRDGDTHTTLQLSLLEPRDKSIFVRVAEDLIEHVGSVSEPAQRLLNLVQRLAEWHRFMRRQAPAALSSEEQRGLFGELDFLVRYAILHCGGDAAIAAWSGPDPGLHDYEFPHLTVEVKTTIAGGPTEFRVSNERQLDDKGLPFLAIYHPLFTETRESGLSLPEMVAGVRLAIGNGRAVRETFEEKLGDARYFEVHEKEYRNIRYVERARSFYRVSAGFPRLVESDLPVGVGSVSYSVSTAACSEFLIPESGIVAMLSRSD